MDMQRCLLVSMKAVLWIWSYVHISISYLKYLLKTHNVVRFARVSKVFSFNSAPTGLKSRCLNLYINSNAIEDDFSWMCMESFMF